MGGGYLKIVLRESGEMYTLLAGVISYNGGSKGLILNYWEDFSEIIRACFSVIAGENQVERFEAFFSFLGHSLPTRRTEDLFDSLSGGEVAHNPPQVKVFWRRVSACNTAESVC